MKQVFTSSDAVYLHHLRNILEAHGIECVIKNDRLLSIAGEIPALNCWPELWVVHSLYANRAKEIIAESQTLAESNESWVCKNCGETHSAQFSDCWNCQSRKAF